MNAGTDRRRRKRDDLKRRPDVRGDAREPWRSPETVYVSRSAAYPADGFLHLDLVGEGVGVLQGLRGPEIFAAMGKMVARRLVVPPKTAIAEITWTIHVNGYPRTGVAGVSLPLGPWVVWARWRRTSTSLNIS